ncbi:hypothetical protein [Micromonospora rifamycinica]|uniref:Uncharacterized protein n=1 Tax=Micromonospora rifamycinica TaxID=291594 RepID=A0A1C5J124_9ACTN|nr:hypothetical protein [Micromonospora rifamycinica]SCG64308.1 hypothetical protein GA0070623_3045 [Micromonospora rifamycinica]
MSEVAVALNTTANLIGFAQGQVKGLTDGVFQVSGFSNAGFLPEVPLNQLIAPVPIARSQLVMVRGSQSRQHVYWLRYLRRGIGITDKKRVCVELLVRFTTFDYVPREGDDGPTDQESAVLRGYPCWGITDLSVSLMATGRGRNPFNKFNESGSLTFDVAAANDGMPHLRINYRVQHQAKNVFGAPLGLSHNDVGAFLVHSNGSFEIDPGEGRTDKHFRITPLSGSVHQRPTRVVPVAQDGRTATTTVLNAQRIELGGIDHGGRMLDPHEHKGMKVIGFDRMDGPNTVTVRNDGQQPVVASAAEEDGYEAALRLEYVRDGAVLGRKVRTKIRALLLLRFTLVPYLTAPDDQGNRQIVYHNGVRYTAFRNVSLRVLEVGRGEAAVVGEKGERYDVDAVKNRHHEESTLFFGPYVEEVQGQVGVQLRIDWAAEHAGADVRSRSHHNKGQFRLGVNQSGSPVLRLLDADSNKYFTVTG